MAHLAVGIGGYRVGAGTVEIFCIIPYNVRLFLWLLSACERRKWHTKPVELIAEVAQKEFLQILARLASPLAAPQSI